MSIKDIETKLEALYEKAMEVEDLRLVMCILDRLLMLSEEKN